MANGVLPLVVAVALYSTGKLSAPAILLLGGVCYAGFLLFCSTEGVPVAGRAGLSFRKVVGDVFAYSVPRIPAGMLAVAAAYFIPWFLRGDLARVAAFLAALLVLQAIHAFTDSLGVVLFPISARWHEEGKTGEISRMLTGIFSFSTQVGLVLSVQVAVWADVIVTLWFGKGYEQAAVALRWLSLSIVPALLFNTTKTLLDGVEKKASTTISLTLGAVVTVVCCAAFTTWSTLSLPAAGLAMLLGLASSVLFNLIALSARISYDKEWRLLAEAVLIAAVLGGVCYYLNARFTAHSIGAVVSLGAAGMLTAVVLVFWARSRRAAWLPTGKGT